MTNQTQQTMEWIKDTLRNVWSLLLLGSLLTSFFIEAHGQGSDWQLPADNYVSAKMDMTVTHPRPEASSWAYSKNAHPGVRWEIPIVIQGGAWPFRYEIVSNGGASGLQIGEELERSSENGFTVHRVTEEYGVLWWESPVAGSYNILVRVHDQDSNSIDVPISLTVGTAGWVFVDPATGDDTNDGSINNPLASIEEIHDRGTAFADHRVYLSGLVPMDGNRPNGNLRIAQGTNDDTPTPAVWVGMPGTNPILEAYEGRFVLDAPDFYMANLEHRHHENFFQDHGSFIHMFTARSRTERLVLHDNHFSRFQGNPNNHDLGNSSIIMFTNFGGNEGRKHVAIVNNTQSGDNGIFTSTYQLRYSVIEKNRGVGASFDLADTAVWAIFWIKGHSSGGSNEYITIRANEMWDNNTWSTNGNLSSAAGMLRARNIEFSYNTLHTPYSALRKGAIGIGDHGTKSDYTWTEDTPVWLYRNSLKQKIYWGGLNYANMPDDNVILERNVLDTGTWPTHDFLLDIENLDVDTYFDSQMKLTGSAREDYLGRYGAEIATQDGGGGVPSDMTLHLDAQSLSAGNGQGLTSWADLSGESNDVSGTGTYVESSNINGYPAVRFDGTDDMFETTMSPVTTEYTLFIVKQVDGSVGPYDASFSSADDLFTSYAFQLDYRNNGMTHTSVGTQGGVNDNTALEIGTQTSTPVVMTVRANGTITQGWLMGVEASGTVSRGQGGFDRFRLGESRSGDNHMSGDIGEVIVYFRSLSDTERGQVEQALMNKWGLSGSTQNKVASGQDADHETLPGQIRLQKNYPNPFNPTTVIGYELPQASQVRLDVYDVTGRHVARLVDGQVSAGRHQVSFDASNLSSGVYLYRLQAGATVQTQKLTIIK